MHHGGLRHHRLTYGNPVGDLRPCHGLAPADSMGTMRSARTGIVLAVGTATMLAARAGRRLGATVTEAATPLPGDELLTAATVQNDRARTIAAPPAAVWPWIAQLGQDRAGFYSFERLENLAGCQIHGATRIHPEWQDVAPGDPFRLHRDVALRVVAVEPGRALVVTSQDGAAPDGPEFQMTWVFHLSAATTPDGAPTTRLHVRERYRTDGRSGRLVVEVTSVISALMTWQMMRRLGSLSIRR